MARQGKVSPIRREYNDSLLQTMQSELSKKGMTRIPGTGVFKFPYKEFDGKYRTGLDPDAAYIKRIQDPVEREAEVERVTKLRDRIQNFLGDVDLGPRSEFWNYAKSTSQYDTTHVQPVKLIDGDNIFDFSDPFKELTFAWLRVHPTIASSLEAWQRGEYPAETQFYIVDEEIESAVTYKKKQLINKAIVKLDSFTPEKQLKIARQLGLPVEGNMKPETVYNLIDNALKQTEFKSGKYQGLNPVEVFHRFADMKENVLHIKDLVKQAITLNIYRLKNSGKIYEGEFEVAKDEDELVKYLLDEDHQADLIELEEKLKIKKIALV